MGVLIDSDVLIEMERGRVPIADLVAGRTEEEFFISVISVSELLHGVHRASSPHLRMRRSSFVEGVLSVFPILPIDQPIARMHARIMSELAARQERVGIHDSWIAASCIAYGLTLLTKNRKDFSRFPGLRFEVWPRK